MSIRRGWIGGLGLACVSALGFACSGEEFCAESRTCTPPASEDGGVGGDDGAASISGSKTGGGGAAGAGAAANPPPGGEGHGGGPVLPAECDADERCDDEDCGVGMRRSVEHDRACVWETNAPWIVYTGDDETAGLNEAFAVKSDLVGRQTPIKLHPKLDAGHAVLDVGGWSPKGTAAVVVANTVTFTEARAYVVRFGVGQPVVSGDITSDLPKSGRNTVRWSPSGKMLGIERDDGFYVFDDGEAPGARVSDAAMANVQAWFKSDGEVVLLGKNLNGTFSILLVKRDADGWIKTPLVSGLAPVANAVLAPDASTLSYGLIEKVSPLSISAWSVETTGGSVPTKMAGPAGDLMYSPAPSFQKFVFAAGEPNSVKLYGGTLAEASSPSRLLEQAIADGALNIIGETPGGCWAPDSSRAALLLPGSFGKRVAVFDTGSVERLHVIPGVESPAGARPLFANDGKLLALHGRTAKNAAPTLDLISLPGYARYPSVTAPATGAVYPGPFTSGGEFLLYRKYADVAADAHETGYVDLRRGVDKIGTPTPLPGAITQMRAAPSGTEIVYLRSNSDCMLVDLAASADPARVNRKGTVTSCDFQPLPR
jgi:hypothetical protein